MNLELSAEQESLATSLRTLFARLAGPDRARQPDQAVDAALLDALHDSGFLDVASTEGGSLIDALLVVEAGEAAYARAPIAARAVVAPLVLDSPPPAIGLVETGEASLVRYAGLCDAYLVLDGPDAYHVGADEARATPTPSRWGYPLGRVERTAGRRLAKG
ncbi:MAG: hypothetical protein ACR2KC_02415, partial [Acidimicrobiales bacterium]